MRLVLVGAPGSGKGTQAKRLCSRLGLEYVGTGDILRESIRNRTQEGLVAEPLLKQGLLVPDPLVNDIVADLFRSDNRPERFVMDGYPRTYAQAVAFDALLRQQMLRLDAVINLEISDNEVVRRISSRRCCSNPECAICYNTAFQPPKIDNVCDTCGAPLILRNDDQEETVRMRLKEFHNSTDALIEHYERAGLLRTIPATSDVETIYNNIVSILPSVQR